MTAAAVLPSILYVVPTLGRRGDYLAQTLDSLQSQDYPAIQVALVAPASAAEVSRVAAARGIEFIAQEGNGISAAINLGWSRFGADHDYWAWLGDDDLLAPSSARIAAEKLAADDQASMVYGRCVVMDEEGRRLYEARPSKLAARLLRWGPDLVPQPGSVARASAVRSAGLLDENLRYAMDLDLFLRLKDVGPIRYVPAVLANFRWHERSTTFRETDSSLREARAVRARTWSGRRAIGSYTEPAATLAGRLLFKLQRRRPRSCVDNFPTC